MNPNRLLRSITAIIAVLAVCLSARAQVSAQENPRSAPSAGSPPRYINFVHERLKPGREGSYDGLLDAIRDRYQRFNIPAYWLELKSLTGPDEMAALNFFDSFAEMQKAVDGIGAGVSAHPELGPMQNQLLEENVSSVTNLIAERVDALGSCSGTIDFAKMRLLHVTIFNIRPGHEAEFAEAAKSVASWYENVPGSPAWVIYAVVAGAPTPSYIMLTAFTSLKDEDAAAARRAPAMAVAGAAAQQRLEEIARSAYASIESNIYFVNPQLSHMPKDFTALDPDYWMPKRTPIR
ncbi:MAG: hypothetical protein WB987_01020 [Candidatus Acidiferrales bacterium]